MTFPNDDKNPASLRVDRFFGKIAGFNSNGIVDDDDGTLVAVDDAAMPPFVAFGCFTSTSCAK
eukprot:CAMPEP_0119566504 /NCGR_PEP_ID=MMETSP1352-20130426/33252_1 /TAXON_ID=265584 /ORGANISM="Stauroneis constricta, Strain CCMP1120" /LENGTH=62 /DNA_ID=CAMNT_0007615623 /DNA_START=127 /DNA_END=315 /DNA_ORIENTATION=-